MRCQLPMRRRCRRRLDEGAVLHDAKILGAHAIAAEPAAALRLHCASAVSRDARYWQAAEFSAGISQSRPRRQLMVMLRWLQAAEAAAALRPPYAAHYERFGHAPPLHAS